MARNKSIIWAMFLLGLFSETHIRIVGSIGIAELFMFLSAPIIFMTDYHTLKRDGFVPVVLLALLSCVGCIISSLHNDTHPELFYRGFASAYALFAVPVVFHHFLRKNINDLRWFFIGAAISSIITIFALRNGVDAVNLEKGGGIGYGELFVARHFGALFSLPLQAFYLQCPTVVAIVLFMIPFIYTILTTSSGRSGVLIMAITVFMLVFVKRRWVRMTALKRHAFFLGMLGIALASVLAVGYKYAAQKGLLNERAMNKYEMQTKKGSGPLALIMSGRGEFFVGLMAAMDEPLWGHGPWPLDKKGYYQDFLKEYGDAEDYYNYNENQALIARTYGTVGYRILPVHSMLVGNWVFFGILGLPYWIYVLVKIVNLLRKYIDAVPQWFGYFSFLIPNLLWNILFSPFGSRVSMGVSIAVVMTAIAVGQRRILLPGNMYWEAKKYDI